MSKTTIEWAESTSMDKIAIYSLDYAGEPLSPYHSLERMMFFYKGIGFIASGDSEIRRSIKAYDAVPIEQIKADASGLLNQLEIIVKEYPDGNMPEVYQLYFCMDVYWLTKIGVIKNDEYNGMSLFYLPKDNSKSL